MTVRKDQGQQKPLLKKTTLIFDHSDGCLSKNSIKILSQYIPEIKLKTGINYSDLFPVAFSKLLTKELINPQKKKKDLGNTFLKISNKIKLPVEVTLSELAKKTFKLIVNPTDSGKGKFSDSNSYGLFDAISNPIVVTDTSFKIIYCNKVFFEFFKSDTKKLYGKKIEQVYSLKSDKHSRTDLRKSLKQNGFWKGIALIKNKSLGEKQVELSLKSIKDSSNKTIAFVGSFFDQTQQLKEKKSIINREERFRVLYENNPLMIFAIKSNAEILSINTKVTETLNYSFDELSGKSILKIISEEEQENFTKHFKKCCAKKNKMFTREIRMMRKNGTTIWAREYACAFTDNHGNDEILMVCDDITSRKAKDDELRLSEEKFFNAFYISPDSININRIGDGLYIDINQGFMRLTGYAKEDVIGKTSNEINIWANDADRIRLILMLTDSGEVSDFEAVFKMKDGRTRVGLMSAKLINVNNEACILSITHDITERKKAENILIENEIKYKSLFDHANDAIFIMKDDIFIDCNTRTLEIFNCSREEIVGQNPFKFSPIFQPDGKFSDAKGIYFIQNAQNGIPQFFEWKHMRLDGALFDAEVSLNKVEFGNETYLQAIVRDVTDRKGAESKIILLAHALKSISESVSITDMSDRIIFLNDAFTKTYGYTSEDLLGNPITRIRSLNNPPEITGDILNKTLKGGWQGELLNIKKDGTEFYIHLSTSVIRDDYGKEIALIGVSTDITERKKAQEELLKAKQRAEEMSKLKSTFLANMSHELRTPLVGILGFAEMMLDDDNASENKLMTEMILNSGKRLLETLNSLLDLARIESNRVEMTLKKFNLAEVVKTSVRAFDGFAYTKNLNLETIIKTDPIEVYLDETILVQIVNNLVNNALKYTHKGGVTVEVDSVETDGVQWCRLKVSDTGIGIPESSKEIIFEEFRQVSEGFNRQFEGTGLGLTLTKKFVQMMNGMIYLDSKLNEGSTFTVVFPGYSTAAKIRTVPYTRNIDNDNDNHPPVPPNQNHKAKVLLVENDMVSAEVTKYYLRNNFELHCCEDGITAIQFAAKNSYDIILMDINLGSDISGTETVQLIRNLPAYKQTPIVALTAFAMEGDKKEFISAGCSHYLSKPFSKHSIVSLLSGIISEDKNK